MKTRLSLRLSVLKYNPYQDKTPNPYSRHININNNLSTFTCRSMSSRQVVLYRNIDRHPSLMDTHAQNSQIVELPNQQVVQSTNQSSTSQMFPLNQGRQLSNNLQEIVIEDENIELYNNLELLRRRPQTPGNRQTIQEATNDEVESVDRIQELRLLNNELTNNQEDQLTQTANVSENNNISENAENQIQILLASSTEHINSARNHQIVAEDAIQRSQVCLEEAQNGLFRQTLRQLYDLMIAHPYATALGVLGSGLLGYYVYNRSSGSSSTTSSNSVNITVNIPQAPALPPPTSAPIGSTLPITNVSGRNINLNPRGFLDWLQYTGLFIKNMVGEFVDSIDRIKQSTSKKE